MKVPTPRAANSVSTAGGVEPARSARRADSSKSVAACSYGLALSDLTGQRAHRRSSREEDDQLDQVQRL